METRIINKKIERGITDKVYSITTETKGTREEFGTNLAEIIIMFLSIITILCVFWLIAYELFLIAHKTEVISKKKTIIVTKKEYEEAVVGTIIKGEYK